VSLILSLFPGKRVCPTCGGPKSYYAKFCRPCSPKQTPLLGRKGSDHPAWKGGLEVDRDGYIRRYAPDHPWPRKTGYVLEHVRIMELRLGRRIGPTEVVHHRDHDRQNNADENLELTERGQHSREHRRLDLHRRRRNAAGQFA